MKGLDDERVEPKPSSQLVGLTSYDLPRGYLSMSQIGMYLRCPRMYEFRYIKGLISPPGIAMVMGTAIHHAVELTHQSTIDTGTPLPIEAGKDLFSDKWDGMSTELEIKTAPTDKDADINTKDVGVRLLSLYHKNVVPTITPVAVEEKVEFKLGDVPMMGYIDLIDRGPPRSRTSVPCVCDTVDKRTKCPKSLLCNLDAHDITVADTKVVRMKKSQAQADNDMQLTAYARAKGTNKVRFDALVKSAKNPRIEQVTATRTAQELAWLDQVAKGVAEGITKGSFPVCPTDSWCCNARFCGYWSRCRGKQS